MGEGPLIVLAYHGVRNIVARGYPFDEGTVSASCEQFDLQMRFVKNNFDVITFKTLREVLEGKIALPKRPLLITFDDGFADNYGNAFPILKKYNLSAAIFLVTGLVGTKEIFWWERVAYWFKKTDFFKVWKQLGHGVPVPENKTQQFVLRYLKDMEDNERLSFLTELGKRFPIIESEVILSQIRPLKWEEILEMSRYGIEFGSHTVTHPLLSKVSEAKLHFELTASKREIESKIGKEVLAIAYPVGGPSDYNEKVIDMAKQAGYLFGLSYSPCGVNNREVHDDRYSIKRIAIETDHSFNRFRSYLRLPALIQ
jgi:peptidoglycan/xylan/chitin deacetylase (PgdA/CDA1 family)